MDHERLKQAMRLHDDIHMVGLRADHARRVIAGMEIEDGALIGTVQAAIAEYFASKIAALQREFDAL